MDNNISNVLIEAFAFGFVICLTFLVIAFLQKGFFWKFLKVKLSQGKKLIVKIRTPLRDYFAVGSIEENFLIYKIKDDTGKYTIRISINSSDKYVYRCLGVFWVDVDEEKNAICKTDYTTVTGFDAKKHSDLHTRALMRPSITSGQEKIILVCVILILLILLVTAYFSYLANDNITQLINSLPELLEKSVNKGTIIGSNSI